MEILWRLKERYVRGIRVYKGVDTSIYEPYMHTFKSLGLRSREVVKLVNLFLKIDADRGGTIDMFEFLMAVDVDRTPFASTIFSVFDADTSHNIDFVEFVLALWNFCSLSDADLCAFAFRCFAKKREATWSLDADDCAVLLTTIYGGEVSKERRMTQQYLEHVIRRTGMFTFEQWTEWTKHNARALFPIFNIRRKMRKHCLGTRFWRRQQRRRKLLFGHLKWEDIEAKLAAIDANRKRRVIDFEDRKPLPFDDDDLEITPRVDTPPPVVNNQVVDDPSWLRDVPPPRQPLHKPPKPAKRYKVVCTHGFDQAVENDTAIVQNVASRPGPTDPVDVKHKPFVPAKRSKADAIAILKTLRTVHKKEAPLLGLPAPSEDDKEAPPRVIIPDSKLAQARCLARTIEGTRPSDRLLPPSYSVFDEPSQLEAAYGIQHLGHMVPVTNLSSVEEALTSSSRGVILR